VLLAVCLVQIQFQSLAVRAFQPTFIGSGRQSSKAKANTAAWSLDAVVTPVDEATGKQSVVGIVGRGYVPTLCAKLCALDGYKTWIVTPDEEIERIESLIYSDSQPEMNAQVKANLSLISASDTDALESLSTTTNAFMLAVDTDAVLTDDVIDFLLPNGGEDSDGNLKRIVGLSRNLNGKGLGFFVKASKLSANNEVWAGEDRLVKQYRGFEQTLQKKAKECGAEYTIVRAGTLKGGACGDETYSEDTDEDKLGNAYFPRYLSSKYYEYTKKDIVTWHLLFDCKVRGAVLAKGDVLEGPGARAVFTATSNDACPGDSSRCTMAEAMVKSLSQESAANIDFGVATAESRTPPTDREWSTLFNNL
jgi:hypothetical protein